MGNNLVLSCAIGDRVISINPAYYPGKVGTVKSNRPGAEPEEFPGGFDITVELDDVRGLCAFDAADLKLGEGDTPRARGLRIGDTAAASAAALQVRGCTVDVTTTDSQTAITLNPGGYLAIAVERYRDTGELMPGVEIAPDASVQLDSEARSGCALIGETA